MSMIPLLVIQITALLPEQHLRHCRKIGSARNAEHPKLTFPRNNFFADQLKKTLLRSILFLNSFFCCISETKGVTACGWEYGKR